MSSDADIDETLPDVVKRFLRAGATLETIRLDANGKWTHEGLDFENPRIIDLFNRSVNRTAGGTWVLEIGRYTYPIEVEDTAIFVESIDLTPPVTVRLSNGVTERLDLTTLHYRAPDRLTCVTGEHFVARFKRRPYHDLLALLDERDGDLVVVVNGAAHPLTVSENA